MKIICFPFAGGNKYSFQKFSNQNNDLIMIEYPGRGMRIKEELMYNIDLLILDLIPKVKNEIATNEDYIIYGHSMGALVGFLICQKIEELGLKKPLKLVVSGKKAPIIPRVDKIANFPNDEFWDEVTALGGIPNEILDYPELIEFYMPILKADFGAIENYIYIKKEKLTIPIDVFYGSEEATEKEINGWLEETTEKVIITKLKGNHFFIFDHIDYFKNYFKNLTETIQHCHV